MAAPTDSSTDVTPSSTSPLAPSGEVCATPSRDFSDPTAQFLYDQLRDVIGTDGCISAEIGDDRTTVCYPDAVGVPVERRCVTLPIGPDTIPGTDPGVDPGEADVCVSADGTEACAVATTNRTATAVADEAGAATVVVFSTYDGTVNPTLRSANETAPNACVRTPGIDSIRKLCSGEATGVVIQTSETAACTGQRLGEELQEDERPRSC